MQGCILLQPGKLTNFLPGSTYNPDAFMNIPFTIDHFFQVFERYNAGVFPLQLVLLALGIVALLLLHFGRRLRTMSIGLILGLLWLWTGGVYHLSFFTAINKAAYGFGAIFIGQGLLFIIEAFRGRYDYGFENDLRSKVGYFFVIFGLVIYPVISYMMALSSYRTISLGLPCPTTIMTFGFLMLTDNRFPKYLLIIPTIWAVIGTGAAINFGIYQDYVMLLVAIVANIYLIRRKRHRLQPRNPS